MLKKITSLEVYLIIIWLFCILLVNPIGDFPLNDDWAYGLNAYALATENQFSFSAWSEVLTLIAHTLWGTLFCKIFGFSFTVLRCSTLVLGGVGILATYHFLHEGGMVKKHAFYATLLVLFNPFFFCLSFTYMTDVNFFSFFVLSAYFFQKTLSKPQHTYLILGTFFSIIATLIRQPGILVPLIFLITYISKNKNSLTTVIQGVTPFIATYFSLTFFIFWKKDQYGLSDNFGDANDLLQNLMSGKVFDAFQNMTTGIFIYWGLFLLPILIISFYIFWKKTPLKTNLSFLFFTLLFSAYFWKNWAHGFHGNVFYNLGIGMRALPNYPEPYHPHLSSMAWDTLKLTGFIGGVIILFFLLVFAVKSILFLRLHFFSKQKTHVHSQKENEPWKIIFSGGLFVGYFVLLLFNHNFFGRYYFTILPFLILIIDSINTESHLIKIPKWISIPALIYSFVLILFSTLGTKDYLEWNRVRWSAADYVINDLGIAHKNLNGGFEFNGWHKTGATKPKDWETEDWWSTNHESYALAFSPQCGYRTHKTFPVQRLFPPSNDSIFILKKQPINQIKNITCDLESFTTGNKKFKTNLSDITFENIENLDSTHAHSGKYSVKINETQPYALTFKLDNLGACDRIWFRVWRYPPYSSSNIVAASNPPDIFYRNESRYLEVIDSTGWGRMKAEWIIPQNYPDSTISFFLFNPSQEDVWMDDVEIIIADY